MAVPHEGGGEENHGVKGVKRSIYYIMRKMKQYAGMSGVIAPLFLRTTKMKGKGRVGRLAIS
jgi:hypothetical protein